MNIYFLFLEFFFFFFFNLVVFAAGSARSAWPGLSF